MVPIRTPRRAKYITGSSNEDIVFQVVCLIGRKGVTSETIWHNKKHNLTWEEVDIALRNLLRDGLVVVSNRRYWPNHRIR
jgi:hypothetical protein